MSGIDVTLTDPSEIVHAVCDLVAGRRVRITWTSDNGDLVHPSRDMTGLLGLVSEVVEVVGCVVVRLDSPPVVACQLVADDEFFVVAWPDVLSVECAGIGAVPSWLHDRLVEVSRWFGHNMEFTLLGGDRLVGDVAGVEYDGAEVEVIVRPTDHVRRFAIPSLDASEAANAYSIPVSQIANRFDWGVG